MAACVTLSGSMFWWCKSCEGAVTDGFEEGLHCWGGGKGGAREMEKEGRGEKEHNTGVRPSII